MPEGDTIHRSATRLRSALEGREVTRFEARRARNGPKPGVRVSAVEARGKHLLVRFDDGRALHTHMGMTGSWHVYAPGERWRKPAHLARAIVEVDGAVAVCFSAPTVEVVVEASPSVERLGPDLCRDDADVDEVLARMTRVDQSAEIANVLLDQRVASGIGNIWKSETLFACGVDPFGPIGALDDETRRQLVTTASRLLRASVQGARHVAVYGRARRPCRKCGTPIRAARQGPHARMTYWCPRCQAAR